jgi:NAD(P)-dependent dehydrogenase (short-subunit alcohol dehydrogenase family)
MGTYAVTGSASGMGHQVAQKLRDAGHTVIGVDIKQADIVADLSTGEGRQAAAVGVLAASGPDWTAPCWQPGSAQVGPLTVRA